MQESRVGRHAAAVLDMLLMKNGNNFEILRLWQRTQQNMLWFLQSRNSAATENFLLSPETWREFVGKTVLEVQVQREIVVRKVVKTCTTCSVANCSETKQVTYKKWDLCAVNAILNALERVLVTLNGDKSDYSPDMGPVIAISRRTHEAKWN